MATSSISTTARPTTTSTSTTTSKTSSTSSSASGQPTCSSPKVRKEWRNLNDGERTAWIAGIKCLMDAPSSNANTFPGSKSLWEDMVSLHQQQMSNIHFNGHFLPWHRYFLFTMESLLASKCNYNGPFVWWNEALDAGKFARAPMFTAQYYGELSTGQGNRGVCVNQAGWGSYQTNIGPGNTVNNPHCISRAVNENDSARTSQAEVDRCMGSRNYDAYRQCNEGSIHGAGHNGVGSVMADIYASPADPAFYLHHSFVDYAYKTWQKGGATRNMEIGGPSPNGGTAKPTDKLSSMGLIPDATIGDVLNTAGQYLCYVYDS